jgi:hypothetical protein
VEVLSDRVGEGFRELTYIAVSEYEGASILGVMSRKVDDLGVP